ncbi:acyl carrier protein [Streptomyces sp. HUCO-GS316]|jgi:act minimal PKS acyl carrier protein|uniref:acyl carrier protein n=1 Tax=Streptomyces sp. HUCO-GS316 TaxID=2692198 RepID=UPI0013688870|nr:phosphopantetheine-binding protein [Streptomyces sp. HUCO-GS316]MXM68992.1 acyl carrier protein [Streptomyces sp. HUCO-GS316]
MSGFTLTELRKVVELCFDGADAAALEEAALDTEFADLGYDSLVVYEIAIRVQEEYHVTIPDEALDELRTPGSFIAYIAARIPADR